MLFMTDRKSNESHHSLHQDKPETPTAKRQRDLFCITVEAFLWALGVANLIGLLNLQIAIGARRIAAALLLLIFTSTIHYVAAGQLSMLAMNVVMATFACLALIKPRPKLLDDPKLPIYQLSLLFAAFLLSLVLKLDANVGAGVLGFVGSIPNLIAVGIRRRSTVKNLQIVSGLIWSSYQIVIGAWQLLPSSIVGLALVIISRAFVQRQLALGVHNDNIPELANWLLDKRRRSKVKIKETS